MSYLSEHVQTEQDQIAVFPRENITPRAGFESTGKAQSDTV